MDERLYHIFEQQDWPAIAKRLTVYASVKVRRLSWRTKSHENLPKGYTPSDIAQQAIADVLGGTRNWNPDKDPDLFKYLCGAVDSAVSNLVTSSDNRKLTNMPDSEQDMAQMQVSGMNGTVPLSRPPETPESIALAQENEDQVLTQILELTSEDEELETLINALIEGYHKPRDIAAVTGMDITLVYQLQRKLKRRLRSLDKGEQSD